MAHNHNFIIMSIISYIFYNILNRETITISFQSLAANSFSNYKHIFHTHSITHIAIFNHFYYFIYLSMFTFFSIFTSLFTYRLISFIHCPLYTVFTIPPKPIRFTFASSCQPTLYNSSKYSYHYSFSSSFASILLVKSLIFTCYSE